MEGELKEMMELEEEEEMRKRVVAALESHVSGEPGASTLPNLVSDLASQGHFDISPSLRPHSKSFQALLAFSAILLAGGIDRSNNPGHQDALLLYSKGFSILSRGGGIETEQLVIGDKQIKISDRLAVASVIFLETSFFWAQSNKTIFPEPVSKVWSRLSDPTKPGLGVVVTYCAHVALASELAFKNIDTKPKPVTAIFDQSRPSPAKDHIERARRVAEANALAMSALANAGVAATRLALFSRMARERVLPGLEVDKEPAFKAMMEASSQPNQKGSK